MRIKLKGQLQPIPSRGEMKGQPYLEGKSSTSAFDQGNIVPELVFVNDKDKK